MTTLAGTWNITMDTPIGTRPAVLEISENDGVITGTAQSKDEKVDFNDAVGDGDRLTCGGVTSGIDLAMWLVAREFGEALAERIATGIEYRWFHPDGTTR